MAYGKDNKINTTNFSKISIGLASPEEILENSSGEVLLKLVVLILLSLPYAILFYQV